VVPAGSRVRPRGRRHRSRLLLVLDQREEEALPVLLRAAALGDAGAMAHLGGVYDFLGKEATAEHWYRRGAELGDPIAVQDLAALTRMREHESR
jgi:TPR repeat protein